MKRMPTKVYAARIKDKEELRKSSSGGAFTALTNALLDSGGAVLCFVYEYKSMEMKYRLVTDKEARNRARGSKYFQSNPNDAFEAAKQWMIMNPEKELLFVGTGCQADGFRKYMQKLGLIDRVCCVDIICTRGCHPVLWKEYLQL